MSETQFWSLYVVACDDGSLYTGISTDVIRRVGEHNSGGSRSARYTKARGPVRLITSAVVGPLRSIAELVERKFKRLMRSQKLDVIAGVGGLQRFVDDRNPITSDPMWRRLPVNHDGCFHLSELSASFLPARPDNRVHHWLSPEKLERVRIGDRMHPIKAVSGCGDYSVTNLPTVRSARNDDLCPGCVREGISK